MHTLLLYALSAPALATDILYQADIRGGVAVDASGVDVSDLGSTVLGAGDDFEVVIPATAEVIEAFVVLHAKPDGFASSPDSVFINGYALSLGSFISSSDTTEVYSLTPPSSFGITGAGSYSYEEDGTVDDGFHFGPGAHGATLVVIYEDTALNGYRHVVVATDNVSDGASVIDEVSEDTVETAVVSYGITNECARDQSNAVVIEGTAASSQAGGSDDGSDYSGTCGGQDWNTLLTQGSFGVDDLDNIVGVSGDLVDGVPSGGTTTNSRLDDELYQIAYDRDGQLTLGYSDTSEDSQLTLIIAVVEIDTDNDGIADSADNCPDTYNPDQADGDSDGIGDACAGCLDLDGDGYGVFGVTEGCGVPDEVDCDDSDPAIHPSADEIWYDGIDQNCDEESDFDQDGDGQDSAEFAGTDCDDTCPLTYLGADEIWYNGEDNACDGGCDYDQDADTCPAAEWYIEAAEDSACDMSCFSPEGGDGADTGTDDTGTDDTGTDDTGTDDTGTEDTGTDDTGLGDDTDSSDCYCTEDICVPEGHEVVGGDCDDTNSDRLPDNPEIWYDGIDQDCDGNDDDQDGDGESSSEVGGPDCDDLDPEINTGAVEEWYNGIDEDCDGNDTDRDGDGYGRAPDSGDDCDDADFDLNPGVDEIWYNGIDENCDGNDDDQDGDGEVAAEVGGADCDDTDVRIYSTAIEVWYDGIDQDCSGTSDYDQDGDGFDRRPEGEDCDDLAPEINPDAEEDWTDMIDQDCDGITVLDTDGDGSPDDVDCDPADASIYPDAKGYDGCDEISSPGLLGLGDGEYKGGGCSQAPSRAPDGLWALGLLLLGIRRRSH